MPEENQNQGQGQSQQKTPQESWEDLRSQRDSATEELSATKRELHELKVKDAIRDFGLSPTEGNGAALFEIGKSADEFDPDALREKAESFGWLGEGGNDGDNPSTTKPPEPTAAEQRALDAAKRQQATTSVASSDTPPSREDQQAELQAIISDFSQPREQRMQAQRELNRLNSQQLVDQFNERR